MSDRKLLGQGLNHEDRISLAQLVNQPGWKILVRLMAEACRAATEEVIKLDPAREDRYNEKVAALQMTARAMNKFSAEVLDSVKVHQRTAVSEAQSKEAIVAETEKQQSGRFKGFKMPVPQESPSSEGTK